MMLFECFKSLSRRKFTVRTRDTFFLRRFWVYSILVQFSKFGGVFNKKNIPLALVGYEMIIANSALRASLAIYHLISNARSWNKSSPDCWVTSQIRAAEETKKHRKFSV